VKNKLKHIVLILSSAFVLFHSEACNPVKKAKHISSTQTDFSEGMIVDMSGLEGCAYMLKIDPVLYYPVSGLKDEFKIDGMKVAVKYAIEIRSEHCTTEKAIRIIDCKKRE
jgi:hypothetical protein